MAEQLRAERDQLIQGHCFTIGNPLAVHIQCARYQKSIDGVLLFTGKMRIRIMPCPVINKIHVEETFGSVGYRASIIATCIITTSA